jgi:sigma-B regulation protein RsbU (phosphoserine phosphatase)
VEDAVRSSKLNPDVADSLNLALEEAVVNVINYAYPEGTVGEVIIDAATNDTALTFTVTDSGKPFDPTAREEVDIDANVEDRPIGGLGIHLVRQIMDNVRYERRGEKNVLILTKKY